SALEALKSIDIFPHTLAKGKLNKVPPMLCVWIQTQQTWVPGQPVLNEAEFARWDKDFPESARILRLNKIGEYCSHGLPFQRCGSLKEIIANKDCFLRQVRVVFHAEFLRS